MAQLTGLLEALAKTFIVIILGYALRRSGVLTSSHTAGIGWLVGRIALPSLLFRSMSTLDLSSVEWFFLLGLTIAKEIVFWLVFALGSLFSRDSTSATAAAALRSVFVTQSNDFALGLPVLEALYPQELVNYLYLTAPIQLIIINPVAFILIELGLAKRKPPGEEGSDTEGLLQSDDLGGSGPDYEEFSKLQAATTSLSQSPPSITADDDTAMSDSSDKGEDDVSAEDLFEPDDSVQDTGGVRLLPILWKVIKTPIVFMTFLGLIANLIFDGKPPNLITETLGLLGGAFAVGALLNLGASMVGKLSGLKGKALLAPLLLIGAKTLLLPILNTVLLSVLPVNDLTVANVTYDLSLFGFVIGTFPTAPGVYVFAVDYGLLVTEMTQGVVLCTIVSAPLMLATAQLADLSITGTSNFRKLLADTGNNLTIVSLIGAVWVFLAHMLLFNSTSAPTVRLNAGVLALCIICFCVAVQTCRVDGVSSPSDMIRLGFIFAGLFAIQITVVINTVSLAILQRRGYRAWQRWQRPLQLISVTVLAASLAAALASVQRPSGDYFDGESCWILMDEAGIGLAIVHLVKQSISLVVLVYCLVVLLRSDGSNKAHADEQQHYADITYAGGSDSSAEDSELLNGLDQPNTPPGHQAVSFRDTLFVIYQMISSVAALATSVWLLSSDTSTGIFAQLAFLEVFLMSCQGVVAFLVFGTKRRYVQPLIENLRLARDWLRRRWVRSATHVAVRHVSLEDMEQDAARSVRRFAPLFESFCQTHVRTRKHKLRKYPASFVGRDFVSFVAEEHIVDDVDQAVTMGKHLLAAGVMQHVHCDHHFEDSMYFYQFTAHGRRILQHVAAQARDSRTTSADRVPPSQATDESDTDV